MHQVNFANYHDNILTMKQTVKPLFVQPSNLVKYKLVFPNSSESLLLTFDPNFGIVLAHNQRLQVSSLEKMTSIIDSTQLAVLNHNALVLSKKLDDSKFLALQLAMKEQYLTVVLLL